MFDVYGEARLVDVGDIDLLVTDHGPKDGQLVVLAHGWPDTASLWRHQIPVLATAGYRVLAPDMRGRGGSGRPDSVRGYSVRSASGDLIALIDDAGRDTAHVVAHDWGAPAAWLAATNHPDRVRSLVPLSAGHPTPFASGGLRQTMRSWYMLLFQFEGVAETWLSQDDWSNLREMTGGHAETENWIAELSGDGALTSSLNWYRANARPERLIQPPPTLPPVRVPTMGVWSSGDFALTEAQMVESREMVESEWRYERIDGASHWIPLDAPERLNQLLLEWLQAHA